MKWITFALLGLITWNMTDYFLLRKNHNAYVDLSKVYSEFDMKKEYEKMVVNQKDNNKNKVDSLELELKQLSMRVASLDSTKQKSEYKKSIADFFAKRTKFMQIKNSMDYRYTENLKSYDEKIWNQINEEIKKFGRENRYDYIYGVAGSGNVMYAREDNDVTGEFVAYLNKQYKGE